MNAILDNMLARDNGYPLDFKLNNIVLDSRSGRYFPATLMHIVVIRNWIDSELARNLGIYRDTLHSTVWRPPAMLELIVALRRIAEDEEARREQFKSGEITLETYKPLMYIGNNPRIVVVSSIA